MADLIGQMLGQYQIVEQIGIGGMATVYKAYQASMDRYVAIKVLPKQLAEDPQFIGRFEQEARTIARLENKHILPVYDYGEQNGYTYLVMRYVGTGTLKDLSARGPLPLNDVVDYLTQIADALQYAHDHGVIHRDVKTSNVLIGEGADCYLTDFGIAKLAASAAHFTGTGSLVGTPAYMSPEQCHGLPADVRSDVYSLGIVLYEMLTGAVPFDAETPVAVVLKQVNDPLPSPRNLNPAIPASIEKVVFRVLAKEPDDRYQSARDFADALRQAVESFAERQTAAFSSADVRASLPETQASAPTAPATVARRARPRWRLFAGVAALVIAVVIIAALIISGGDEGTDTGAATSPAVPETPGWTIFTSTSGDDWEDRQLLIDEHGLWMNTGGGLVRWQRDGTYTKYTGADGLAFNDIQTMAFDQAGSLWLGGGDQEGAIRLELDAGGDITHFDYYNMSNSRLYSSEIWTFLPGPDGTMLVGTYESLLEQWDGQEWTTPDIPTEGLDVIGDRTGVLLRTQDGTLWAGGPNGLARMQGDTWEVVPPPPDLQTDQYTAHNIMYLYEDPLDGAIWVNIYTEPDWNQHTRRLVAGGDGTWAWGPGDEEIPSSLNRVLRASDNSLWVLGEDSVVRVDGQTGSRSTFTSSQGIRGDSYLGIVEDIDGTIWLTTDTALAYYEGRRWISFSIENEPPSGGIAAMAEAPDGKLWFVSEDGLLAHYQDDMWTMVESFDIDVYDMILRDGVIWIASGGGLYRWQNGVSRLYSPANSDMNSEVVFTLAADPNNPAGLWFGTIDGLHWLNTVDETMRFWSREQNDFPGPAITALYFDNAGALWVGTAFDDYWIGPGEAALLKIANPADPDNLSWEVEAALGDPLSEIDWDVLAIASDDQDNLWIGTGESLYRQNTEGQWQKLIESDGAPEYESIGDILFTENAVWIAVRYKGLYRYDAAGWYNLEQEGTGMADSHRLYRTTDGALWVLTSTGAARLMGDPFALD